MTGTITVRTLIEGRAEGANDKQHLEFRDYDDGDTFNLSLDEETSPSLAYSSTGATLAATIEAALKAFDAVDDDDVIVTPAGGGVDVEFAGKNGNQPWSEISPRTIAGDGAVIVSTLQQGKAGGEPLMSATRGYPRTGAFYQGRLLMGGFYSRPQTVVGSRIGEHFNFEVTGRDNGGIDQTLDTDDAQAIRALFPARHLQAFTSSSGFYFPIEPITSARPGVKQASKAGMFDGPLPLELDGGTLFLQVGEEDKPSDALSEFFYVDAEQSYRANIISTKACDVVKGVMDLAIRRRRSANDPDIVAMVREDGRAVILSALRSEEVAGFCGWATDGDFLAVAAEQNGDLYFAVRRYGRIRLERLRAGVWLDAAKVFALEEPTLELEVPHLPDGVEATVIGDGDLVGTFTVADGKVTLAAPLTTWAQVGLHYESYGETMPADLGDEWDQRPDDARAVRVPELRLVLGPTVGVEIDYAGETWPLRLGRLDEIELDRGPIDYPFEGAEGLDGIPGHTPEGAVRIRRAIPGPFEVRQISRFVRT